MKDEEIKEVLESVLKNYDCTETSSVIIQRFAASEASGKLLESVTIYEIPALVAGLCKFSMFGMDDRTQRNSP